MWRLTTALSMQKPLIESHSLKKFGMQAQVLKLYNSLQVFLAIQLPIYTIVYSFSSEETTQCSNIFQTCCHYHNHECTHIRPY